MHQLTNSNICLCFYDISMTFYICSDRVFFISSYSVVFFRQCVILTVLTVWNVFTVPTVWYFNSPDSVVFYLFRQCGILTVPTVWNVFTVPTCAFLLFFFKCYDVVTFFFFFRTVPIVWYYFNWVVNFAFICSNIPSAPAYEVYVSQLKRYSRSCGS